ncbi:hypothetical protein F7734_31385 [Scytonema sp. UIC 10036]|uniref:hypothetical protein n=1 Tax=Scytonema sp. UIC 10036 TaxID=2304196 RepID=UPI0012DAC0D2|nr:hypothetical protein [Scytonema sp. UIC 10036]MUG96598.1 hypothetical protein [Scytonema sp. UIC 10036]
MLVGGDVRLERGFLGAFGGSIELGGLAEPGTVGLWANNGILSLNFPKNVARADVSITDAARLNVLAGNGGSIAINAANINVSGDSRLFAGIDVEQGSVNSQAGDITLNATGAIKINESSLIINDVNRNATGNSGNINVIANSVSLTDEAQLSASTYGRGNAGSVKVSATDSVIQPQSL